MTEKVYKMKDIETKLRISKATAYRFVRKTLAEQKPFRVLQIGDTMRIPKHSFDQWLNSDVYLVKDIQEILKLSHSGAYAFINDTYKMQEPFPVLKVLTLYRIPKAEFDKWFEENLI